MRFLPASDTALLVELDDLAQTTALYRTLMERPINGVQDMVPAARTILVYYRQAVLPLQALITALRDRYTLAVAASYDGDTPPGRLVEIPVRYIGEDLAEVAEMLGVSTQEVIARHTGQPYLAAFAGFAPGFMYLAEGHPDFHIPRRKSPRKRVPAGSVALGGDFSAVYPTDSPGGWQLIGVTDIAMWDLNRAEPAYVQPGFRVQFIDAAKAPMHVSLPPLRSPEAQNTLPTEGHDAPPTLPQAGNASIEVLQTGLQTLFQDAGRYGMSSLGISPSGALDATSLREANRLVGNPVGAAVLENVLGELRLRSHGRVVLAVTGADAALSLKTAGGLERAIPANQPVGLNEGDTLIVGRCTAGVRCYVAARGGWDVEPVLGSCATDTLARIGPPALFKGQRLGVGNSVPPAQLQAVHTPEPNTPGRPLPRPGDLVTLDVVLGPRTDWFTPEAIATFSSQTWRVTQESNRVGIRLEGAQPLSRQRHDELPSEGTVTGAIQVPINGQPVLFLADHPLTGGYPVIAAVASHHLYLAAQLPVDSRVRFNIITPFFDQG